MKTKVVQHVPRINLSYFKFQIFKFFQIFSGSQLLSDFQTFLCEKCGKEFTQKKNMLRHQNIHLQEKYKCKECNSTLKSHRTLKEHNMKIHHSETYSCDKSFSCKAYMKKHSKTHSAEKTLQCEYCPSVFLTNSKLKRQIKYN